MKQIPNIFTLLNLLCGCMAIVFTLQAGLTTVANETDSFIIIPEKIYLASIMIGIAAVIDFLDGFVARLLNAASELGKQLDSLSDVVSFGAAPGMIAYQFLRLSYAGEPGGLDTNMLLLLPAFFLPLAGAYRLARFNIDTKQTQSFTGLPIPAAGLLIASFPLIYWHSNDVWLVQLLQNKWFWYALIIIVSWLMVSRLPMMALKFKNFSLRDNLLKYVLIILSIAIVFTLQWLSVPAIFIVYVAMSLLSKDK